MNKKQLKIIACLCMFYDHLDRILPIQLLLAPLWDWLYEMGQEALIDQLFRLLNYIGRLAAPIFLFCIVDGFFHTHDKKRYIQRVAITALLAQVPYILFNMAEMHTYGAAALISEIDLNILFTLSLGLIAIWLTDTLLQCRQYLLAIISIITACLLATCLHMEGKYGYILILFAFYFLKDQKRWLQALLFIPIVILSRYRLFMQLFTETDARMVPTVILNIFGNYLGLLIPICFYNGQKGSISKTMQLGMYAFYPLHLLVLGLIGLLR